MAFDPNKKDFITQLLEKSQVNNNRMTRADSPPLFNAAPQVPKIENKKQFIDEPLVTTNEPAYVPPEDSLDESIETSEESPSDFVRKKLQDRFDKKNSDRSNLNIREGVAALGNVIAGRDPSSAKGLLDGKRKEIDDQFLQEDEIEKKIKSQSTDSPIAKAKKEFLVSIGMSPDMSNSMTNEELDAIIPIMEKKYGIDQTARNRQDSLEESRMRHKESMAAMAQRNQERRDDRRDREDEKDLQNISKDLKGTQDLYNSIDEVELLLDSKLEDFNTTDNKLTNKNGDKVDLPGVSIPGIGRTSFYSPESRKLEGAASRVFNATLKDRSGTAVTDNELQRLRKEFNDGKFNKESEIISALQAYKRQVNTLS